MSSNQPADPAAFQHLTERIHLLRETLAAAVVGQTSAVDEVLTTLLAGGHILLEGVPGIAKTLLARSLAQALGLHFRRIQFTPDLMPSDVVGGSIFDFQRGQFKVQHGPIFTQVLLADEINRTPPKTQAALLEAMQERQVTIDGQSFGLADPFLVIATQNPLEHEGTYPLPEAQLDRFLMKVRMVYPAPQEEQEIYRRSLTGQVHLSTAPDPLPAVFGADELPALRRIVGAVHVEEPLLGYLLTLITATRKSPLLSSGASPRAGVGLLAAARAWAALEGRTFLIPDDIKRMALPVLRHRLILTPEAELESMDADRILATILNQVEVPR